MDLHAHRGLVCGPTKGWALTTAQSPGWLCSGIASCNSLDRMHAFDRERWRWVGVDHGSLDGIHRAVVHPACACMADTYQGGIQCARE